MSDKMPQDDADKKVNNQSEEQEQTVEEKASTEETPAASEPVPPKEATEKAAPAAKETLQPDDIDTVGEIGNIFMGSAATTLSQLLNNKVDITTPQVELFESLEESYVIEDDQLIVEITYKKGLQGTVILALKKKDSAILADLMMGGTGKIESDEIGEIQISAVGEAMNQMVGTASTTLSGMLKMDINITPPEVKLMEKGKPVELCEDLVASPIVAIKFKLLIGDVLDTEIIQFMSVSAAKSQVTEVQEMMKEMSAGIKENLNEESVLGDLFSSDSNDKGHSDPISQPASPPPQDFQTHQQVTVQPVQFSSFDKTPTIYGETNKNLTLVMDVKLELTVELGRTELPIKNVLELTRGSILELDKVAGEPVELFANGKLIAKGEVVVIEDNFGLRITSIVSPEQRIQEL